MSNDFLWECALKKYPHNADTTWLAPNDWPSNNRDSSANRSSFRITRRQDSYEKKEIVPNSKILIRESREYGILDNVGGELWEAAFLLCSYLLLHPELNLVSNGVLEFGSGVGLPGFLVTYLKRCVMEQVVSETRFGDVFMTDFEDSLLEGLVKSAQYQFLTVNNTVVDSMAQLETSQFQLTIEKLDWNWFANGEVDSTSRLLPKCEIAIGSALCYSSSHIALADTIRALLEESPLQEVVIIQIQDRPGFSLFLSRLEALQIHFILQPVSVEVFDLAYRMGRGLLRCHQIPGCSSECEDVGAVYRWIEFPVAAIDNYVRNAIDVKQTESSSCDNGTEQLPSFLTTEREAFVVLRISAGDQSISKHS